MIPGEIIEKKIIPELTYKDLYAEDVNARDTYLWSVLLASGYLTETGKNGSGLSRLKIPNKEIREIYDEKIMDWFSANV